MTQSRDTSPDAERVRIRLLRAMPMARKLALLDRVISSGRALAMIGLRHRHPGLSPEELETQYVRLVLGPELAESFLAARRARAKGAREG